jgi:hypothetical protein
LYIVQAGKVKFVCLKPLKPAVKLKSWVTENCKEIVYTGTPGRGIITLLANELNATVIVDAFVVDCVENLINGAYVNMIWI